MSFFFNIPTQKTKCVEDIKKITFDDCLACSGCISEDEHNSFKIDCTFLNIPNSFDSIIISSQIVISLYQHYRKMKFEIFERCFISFLKNKFNLKMIVNSSYFKKIKNKNNISSECPAVVLYIERVFPKLLPILSKNKTFQQIASDFITKKIKNSKILSIMQCYDKKNEIKRDSTTITYFLGTKEFFEHIMDDFENYSELNIVNKTYLLEDWEKTYIFEEQEVCGLENMINLLNQAKKENLKECIELRACKGGCLKGPAQLDNKIEKIEYEFKKPYFYFKTNDRVFIKPKKKTFSVNW